MKKTIVFILSCILLLSAFAVTASADTGPKPSVRITLDGLPEGEVLVTLLSEHESTGPWCTYERYPELAENMCFDEELFMRFVEYRDSDGYHFLQYGEVFDGEEFAWTYYPPSSFKLLLYFPATDEFVASGIYERYAFDSYYHATLSEDGLSLEKSYDYTDETVSLIARILITFAAELLLAVLAFGYRGKMLFLMLVATNLVTQIALNLTVNIQSFYNGDGAYVFYYVMLEAVIFLAEAAIYYFAIPKLSKKPASRAVAVAYAFSANLLSLILGLYISSVIPGLF